MLIKGGLVIDGTGKPPVPADVRTHQDQIVAIAPRIRPSRGEPTVDAHDCWVLPGFVDPHSHADLAVLTGDLMHARHTGGITTEVVGQDGLGFTPLLGEAKSIVPRMMEPISGPGYTNWTGVGEYLDICDREALSRVVAMSSHGTIRIGVMGMDERLANPAEIVAMRHVAEREAAEGARGLSTGLSYPPARAASIEELVAVYEPFARRGLPYATHLRDYGTGFGDAIAEAIEVARRANGHLHLSHFHVSGADRRGAASTYLEQVRDARATGLKVTLDSYPYTSGCTLLMGFLPNWALADGPDGVAGVLSAQGGRAADELDKEGPGPTAAVGWEGFILTGLDDGPWKQYNDTLLVEAARTRGLSPGQAVVDLCRNYPSGLPVLIDQGFVENIAQVANDPGHMAGSDGIMGGGMPHPRAVGTFLRFLRWARDGEIAVCVSEMVRRMTSAPADLVGLGRHGRLWELGAADILVVDPALLEDGPELGQWRPKSIRHSLIGGRTVVDASADEPDSAHG